MARAVADAIGAPVDVFLVRKLVPGEPELRFGAIAEGPVRVIDQVLVRECNITPEIIKEIASREHGQMELRRRIYHSAGLLGLFAGRTSSLSMTISRRA